jgi:flagella basal body P-ring formation protein FlgA
MKFSVIAIIFALIFIWGQLHFSSEAASKAKRIIDIKDRIVATGATVKLKDIVINQEMLSDKEKELEITETPDKIDRIISLINMAYLFQRHHELMDTRLRGPKNIVIQRRESSEYVNKAKKQILEYIRSHAPWKDWEVDMLFSSNDELLISKVGAFDRVEVFPYDNKRMVGTVGLRIVFYDDKKRENGKASINPVILRKVDVFVMNNNVKRGQIISKYNIKTVPIWIGEGKKDYVTAEKNCIGRELARNVNHGDIIRGSDLLNPVCAKKGDSVWVECLSGSLAVRLVVTALEDGREGDFIKVMNRASKSTFRVELTGEKQGKYKLGS